MAADPLPVYRPLIRRDLLGEVLAVFWNWFQTNPSGCRILDTNLLLAEREFHQAWTETLAGETSVMLQEFPRPFMVSSGTFEDYLSIMVSRKHQGEYFRSERKLAQMGRLEYRLVEDSGEVESWIEQFLQLEASGWKGQE